MADEKERVSIIGKNPKDLFPEPPDKEEKKEVK